MFTRLSLRLRIFLFFCLVALGGAALAGGSLYFGFTRTEGVLPSGPFVTAFVMFAFLFVGLVAVIWLLFDENVAKPIERLAAELRLRAHSGVDTELSAQSAKYLGDLAPAACAVTSTLSSSMVQTAAQVARETERLKSESARLTAVLTGLPTATVLVNPSLNIVLYDGQAADVLGQIARLRLRAPLSDYFERDDLATLQDRLITAEAEFTLPLRARKQDRVLDARVKPLGDNGCILIFDPVDAPLLAKDARPLVYDFDLLTAPDSSAAQNARLRDLCFVAFDTETTGLMPQSDDVVQIGAVRVLNGRIVEGETLDSFVDPGRPIPPASTKVHGISDADVAGAPCFAEAGRDFHHFSRDAVLVAHNAPFDLAFLHRFEAEMGVDWSHPVLDTVLLSAAVFGTTEQHTLDALCTRLGVTIPEHLRHTALGDAQATAEALVKLIPLLEAKGLESLGDVIAECRRHGRLLKDMNPIKADS